MAYRGAVGNQEGSPRLPRKIACKNQQPKSRDKKDINQQSYRPTDGHELHLIVVLQLNYFRCVIRKFNEKIEINARTLDQNAAKGTDGQSNLQSRSQMVKNKAAQLGD